MSDRFTLNSTPIDGVSVVERHPIGDSRGFFERLFCADELASLFQEEAPVQINRSFSRERGTVRGLHFQPPPHAEGKFVSCLQGEIFDVAVDLRAGSPTFLRWYGEILSRENHRSLFIPPGCAHGFQTLSEDCELLYLHTHSYTPEAEAVFHPLSPRLGITWPLPVTSLSDRDAAAALIEAHFPGIAP